MMDMCFSAHFFQPALVQAENKLFLQEQITGPVTTTGGAKKSKGALWGEEESAGAEHVWARLWCCGLAGVTAVLLLWFLAK